MENNISGRVLIGGCGSTGSTLLRHILNRHDRVFCGPELNFFNKEQLFRNWQKEKRKIKWPSRFLPTEGWVPYTGTRLLNPEYRWNKKDLYNLIDGARTITEFSDEYFRPVINENDSDIWIEKTPSNSYSFDLFLKKFENSKVIHIARSPYATVASFIKRGFSPVFAAGMYIYNMSAALKASNNENYYYIKYEDLVEKPEDEISSLLSFLDLDFDDNLLFPESGEEKEIITSWQNQPNQGIRKTKSTQFERASQRMQKEIVTALSVFKIRSSIAQKKSLPYVDCESLCDALEYNFKPEIYPETLKSITRDFKLDQLKRSIKFFPTRGKNYPAKLIY